MQYSSIGDLPVLAEGVSTPAIFRPLPAEELEALARLFALPRARSACVGDRFPDGQIAVAFVFEASLICPKVCITAE